MRLRKKDFFILKIDSQGQAQVADPGGEKIKIESIGQSSTKIIADSPVVFVGTVNGTVYVSGIPAQLQKGKNAPQDVMVLIKRFNGRPDEQSVEEESHKTVLIAVRIDMPKARNDAGHYSGGRRIFIRQMFTIQALFREIE